MANSIHSALEHSTVVFPILKESATAGSLQIRSRTQSPSAARPMADDGDEFADLYERVEARARPDGYPGAASSEKGKNLAAGLLGALIAGLLTVTAFSIPVY